MADTRKNLFPDIVVFPKIGNSYAIRTEPILASLNPRGEWILYGWHGYMIGSFYDTYDGGGGLFLRAGSHYHGHSFEEITKKHDMPSIENAVMYAWLKNHQRLINSNPDRPSSLIDAKLLARKDWEKKDGLVFSKKGIRAFAGGPREESIFSLFDSEGRIIGCLDENDEGFRFGRKYFFNGRYENVIEGFRNETDLRMLDRLMLVLARE